MEPQARAAPLSQLGPVPWPWGEWHSLPPIRSAQRSLSSHRRAPQPAPGPTELIASRILMWCIADAGYQVLRALISFPLPVSSCLSPWDGQPLCPCSGRVHRLAWVAMAWQSPRQLPSLLFGCWPSPVSLFWSWVWVSLHPLLRIPSCEGVECPWEESWDGSSPGGYCWLTQA